jgi:hypothetical protein
VKTDVECKLDRGGRSSKVFITILWLSSSDAKDRRKALSKRSRSFSKLVFASRGVHCQSARKVRQESAREHQSF